MKTNPQQIKCVAQITPEAYYARRALYAIGKFDT